MKRDPLVDIAARTERAAPLVADCLNFCVLEGGSETFEFLLHALHEEFPFLWYGNGDFSAEQLDIFDGLFSWLVESLRAFPIHSESPSCHIVKLLAVAHLLERDHAVWTEISKAVPSRSSQLVDTLVQTFECTKVDSEKFLRQYGATDAYVVMIRSHVEARDWHVIEWVPGSLSDFMGSELKRQASAALYEFDRQRLLSSLDSETDFFQIASYVVHAPAQQSVPLALESTNWTLKFWALQNSAREAAAGKQSFGEEWVDLLLSAANAGEQEWTRWMLVLNEYPSRYPQLQPVIGKVLSISPEAAVDIYVSTLKIDSVVGFEEALTALSTFRSSAPLPQRKRLWTAAFERWHAWDFGQSEHSNTLGRIARSVLDFAVVGYMTECMDVEARATYLRDLEYRARAFELQWHPSISSAIAERFRIISAYQLVSYAGVAACSTGDWLPDTPLVRPPWEDGTVYRSLKYETVFGRATFLNN